MPTHFHISIPGKYLHNLNKFMRSSSHFQFGEESSSGCAQQNLCKVTGKSGAQKTVIVIGLENERSAIENRELRIENRESTIHVWADEIESKFKFSDRGGSLQNTEHRVMELSRWSLGLDHDSYRLAFS